MKYRLFGAAALFFALQAAHSQGVVSPVANPASNSATAPAQTGLVQPAPAPATPPSVGFNPFKPPAPVTQPINVNMPPPPPPIDPAVIALAEELQEIREKGERVGTVDGKIIFRYQGKYLVEALVPEELAVSENQIDPAKRQAALAGECVIRVVTADSAAVAQSAPATP